MPTLKNLQKQSVFIKVRDAQPAPATVTDVDEHGLWFVSADLVKALHYSGLPRQVERPDIFVLFGSIDWLMVQPQD